MALPISIGVLAGSGVVEPVRIEFKEMWDPQVSLKLLQLSRSILIIGVVAILLLTFVKKG